MYISIPTILAILFIFFIVHANEQREREKEIEEERWEEERDIDKEMREEDESGEENPYDERNLYKD